MIHQVNHMKVFWSRVTKNSEQCKYFQLVFLLVFVKDIPTFLSLSPHVFFFCGTERKKKLYNMISLKNGGNSFIYLQMLLDITMRFKSLYQRKKHAF